MFCSKCGNPIPLDSEFCNKCGEKIKKDNNNNIVNEGNNNINQGFNNNPINNINNDSIQTNTNGYNQLPNNNKNILIIIGCIIGAIVLMFIGYNIYNQIRLHIIDNKVQKEANRLGDIDDFDTNKSNNSSSSQKKKNDYEVGDAVKLVDGSSWHVIRKSTNGQIVLLSDILVKDSSPYGKDASEASQKYENSIVKQYIENTYLPSFKQSLLNNNGDISNLSVRLITVDEYLSLVGEKFDSSCRTTSRDDRIAYSIVKKSQEFLTLTSDFWTMSNIHNCNPNDSSYGAYHIMNHGDFTTISRDSVASDGVVSGTQGNAYGIRPVVEVSIKNIK